MIKIVRKSVFLYNTRLKILLLFLLFFLIVAVFIAFRAFEKSEIHKIEQYVEILLRNEINASNPYSVSKSLADLQLIGLFESALLRNALAPQEIFYDTLPKNKRPWNLLYTQKVHIYPLTSVRGTKFELLFVRQINFFAIAVELIIYGFVLALATLIPIRIDKMAIESKRKIQAVETEKRLMVELAKQVQHDIASPLTVLRTIAAVSKDQHPEVYEILTGAVKRTEEIFSDFSQNRKGLDPADLFASLNCIIFEKKAIWGEKFDCKILTRHYQSTEVSLSVACSEGNLKRILSNIFNNSYEAVFGPGNCSGSSKLCVTVEVCDLEKHVLVKISDNGPGFPEFILSQIGNKGITFGKQRNDNESGSGIGLHHAKKILNDLGGYVEFKNLNLSGAVVSCYLPKQ